jgi:hypothetical protein
MYVKVTGGTATQYSTWQLRKDNPQTSFPLTIPDMVLAEFDVFPFTTTTLPNITPSTQKVVESEMSLIDGQWTQTWAVVTLSAEEQAAYFEQLKSSIVSEVQSRLDTFANSRNYDGILSACTYAGSTIPTFQSEGEYCVLARDTTWAALYQIMADVQSGARPAPANYAEIESELPALVWP